MTSSAYIIYSGFATSATRIVYPTSITIGGRKNVLRQPLENGTALARVQTQSYENPTYSLNGVVVDLSNTNSIQYKDVLSLYTMKYDGTNAPVLRAKYNTNNSITDTDTTTTDVPIILESYNFPIDMRDSKDGYRPTATLNFVGTR